ncbi:Mitochondrial copper homeostasis protein [Coccidioides posadasii str. Silveira]|uniref:Mitochondrial copper homeostasis protein n=1 Tax=Coccidioides posadasii (strain RMSCC 757 / Silveira) TaxID=443226 RepID=UPI001BEEEAF3|nr:Mitochondrial copper homeostasis protein [Coccidioides posadasii str. Silveira]
MSAQAGAAQAKEDESHKYWGKAEQQFKHKPASQFFDPCQEFADRSIKCMRRNAGDRDMCTDYFQAYRDCKKAWMTQRKEASR